MTKSVAAAVMAAIAITSAMIATPSAQSNDPTTQPRLTPDSLTYVGGFRVPSAASNGATFEFGGRQIAFNPANNSLFVGTRTGHVAEVSIPAAVYSSNPAAMPFASYLQPFADPTEGRLGQVGRDGVALDGLMVYNNRLYGTASIYYDALNEQRVSHYSRSLQLNQPSFSGWSSVWDAAKTGFVSGAMATVPSEWQTLLGGPAATGQCCIPIVTRTSWGPSAFAFNPAQISPSAPAPALPLLYYTGEHPTLGNWLAAGPSYGATTTMGGMAIIAGTRTALFIGRNGIGEFCYGNGTSDPALAGLPSPDGSHYCYDPTSNDKGQHAYPYRYQIWAYDLNDFAAVKAGTKQPWEVVPYGVWPLDLPTPELMMRIGGVSYDAATQQLYISQMYADQDGYAFRPIIHVFRINAAADAISPQASATAMPMGGAPSSGTSSTSSTASTSSTTTSGSTVTALSSAATIETAGSVNVVTAVSLAANRTSPQLAGTTVAFSASVVGGAGSLEYQWTVANGTNAPVVGNWTASDTFTWTPATAGDQYRVSVSVRNGTTRGEAEALISTPFVIVARPELRAVTFTPDKPSPQTAGSAITFTADTGGAAAEYRWLLHDGMNWSVMTNWSTHNTFTWIPAAANPDAHVGIWARRLGSTQDQAEFTFSLAYPVMAVAAAPVASGPQPALPINEVNLTTSVPAPQAPGTTITAQATVVGGSSTLQYRWLIHDGRSWQIVTDWTGSSKYSWTPTAANAGHFIGVWVRNAINVHGDAEATRSIAFPIQ